MPEYKRTPGAPSGATGGLVAEVHAVASVVNSAVEATLATLALPQNLRAGDRLHARIVGDLLNNTAGAVNYTPRIKLGGTTLFGNTAGISQNASRRNFFGNLELVVVSTTSEEIGGSLVVGLPGGGWSATLTQQTVYATAAEDLTAGLNLLFTVQLGTADPLADFRLHAMSVALARA